MTSGKFPTRRKSNCPFGHRRRPKLCDLRHDDKTARSFSPCRPERRFSHSAVWSDDSSTRTYGTTDENGAIVQPIQAPNDVFPQFGGLEVTTSSTQLQELTDAFIYLYRYPYNCTEQVASRMISIAALRDVLQAFKAKEMPSEAEIEKSYAKDIEILKGRQREDGSFGLWSRNRERYEYPFLTVHVAHALVLAKAKGYKVPDEMLNKTKPYLKNVEKYYDGEWYTNSPQVRWTISAYALYVRDLMGDKDAAKAKKLLAEATIEKMPFEALGWILSVLADDKNSTNRSRSDQAIFDESHDRNRRDREFRHRLRRRCVADYVFQSPRRRRFAGSINQSRAEQRSDSETRSRFAR